MIGPYRARSNRLFNKNDFVFDLVRTAIAMLVRCGFLLAVQYIGLVLRGRRGGYRMAQLFYFAG